LLLKAFLCIMKNSLVWDRGVFQNPTFQNTHSVSGGREADAEKKVKPLAIKHALYLSGCPPGGEAARFRALVFKNRRRGRLTALRERRRTARYSRRPWGQRWRD